MTPGTTELVDVNRREVVLLSWLLVSDPRDGLRATDPDRDHWRHQAETLSRNVSELTAILYRLDERKVLPSPPRSKKESPWWMFWRQTTPLGSTKP